MAAALGSAAIASAAIGGGVDSTTAPPVDPGGGGTDPPAVDPFIDTAPATVYSGYAALQSSMARWLHRDDLGDMLPEFIALAEARLNREIRLRQQLTTITLTASAGNPAVTMPATWLEWKRLRLVDPDRELLYITPGQRIGFRLAAETGAPTSYTIEGNSLVLMPIPDAAYTIEATFYARLPTLSAANPNTWLLTAHPGLYLFGALQEAAAFLRDDDRVPLWATKYATELSAAKMADTAANHSGSPLRVRAR